MNNELDTNRSGTGVLRAGLVCAAGRCLKHSSQLKTWDSFSILNKFVKLNWLAEREYFRKSTPSNQTELNHTKPNSSYQTELNYTKPNLSIPNQTHPHQTELIHTKLHQTKLKTELIHTKSNSSIPNWTQLHQTKLIHNKPNSSTPNQTHQYQTELNCIWCRTGPVCLPLSYLSFRDRSCPLFGQFLQSIQSWIYIVFAY